MKKEEADTLKQFVDEEDGFGKNPLSVMSEEDYKSDLENFITKEDFDRVEQELKQAKHILSVGNTSSYKELIDRMNMQINELTSLIDLKEKSTHKLMAKIVGKVDKKFEGLLKEQN